ncbi:MAG: hypothetical protein H7320_02620 [Ferruginibacter sp.]|nr:hypothetical protein [Ferruginibacter sp.]
MPALRSASLCALFSFLFFSCSRNTENQVDSPNKGSSVINGGTIKALPGQLLDLSAGNKKFISAATQRFSVPAKRISLLTSKCGLRIIVNPAVLEKENGNAAIGNIEVSIVELTTVHDLYKSNAATVSNGRLLVSGGSYFIGMQNGGEQLRIKAGNTLQVEFPALVKNDMELFYGERDSSDNMNWTIAGNPLEQQYDTVYFNSREVLQLPQINIKKGYYLYNSINARVNFMGSTVTIKKMVDMLQNKGLDKIIDTVYHNWNSWCSTVNDVRYSRENTWPGFAYGGMQFRVISRKESTAERDSLAKSYLRYQEMKQENATPGDIKIRLKKNYAPSNVTALGWINCDRFYNAPGQAAPGIELPYAFTNSQISYFILFKNFNGLLTGRSFTDSMTQFRLQNIPLGETVTLIAFTKKDGTLYRGQQDFIVEKNTVVPLDLKKITDGEATDIFGVGEKS